MRIAPTKALTKSMPTLILCFHRVADPQHGGRSLLAISPEDFRRTLELVGARYRFVDLEEGSEPSKEKKAVVTFDDGYADNLHTALPILQEMGIPATFFISTGFIGTEYLYPPDVLDAYFSVEPPLDVSQELRELVGLGYWKALEKLASTEESSYWRLLGELSAHVRQGVLEQDPLRRPMTAKELSELAGVAGVKIGPHSVTHRRLSSLSLQDASEEISVSLGYLSHLGLTALSFFAYPFGQPKDVSRAVSEVLRACEVEPLTTFPAEIRAQSVKAFGKFGTPRLSVGPVEVALLKTILKLLPLGSRFPRLWLTSLALRRRLVGPSS